jgi:hypothetical protein
MKVYVVVRMFEGLPYKISAREDKKQAVKDLVEWITKDVNRDTFGSYVFPCTVT